MEATHVTITAAGQQRPYPGVLLEWRRTPAGEWEGLCVWVSQDHAHQPYPHVHQSWIDADKISRYPM